MNFCFKIVGFFDVCRVRQASSLSIATGTNEDEAWSPNSWKTKTVAQPPKYEDDEEYEKAIEKLEGCSPLVFAGEVIFVDGRQLCGSL